jgi:hypothetical protein
MARTSLTPNSKPDAYPALPVSADALDLAFEAADFANKNQFAPSGDDLVLAKNDDASAQTVTITSVVDDLNRTGDIETYSIGAGEIAVFRVKSKGYMQTDGKIYLEASSANVKFAVIPI